MDPRTILITGGSRGIGRAVVEALLADGHRVAFTYRSQEQAATEIVERSEGLARAFRLDLTDRRAPDELIRTVEDSFGEIDGLVNNAGVRREALLAMTSDEDWDAVMETNLGGLFRSCRAVLPRMVSRRRGSIVNVASLSALHGLPGQAAYGASKAGVVGLTRSLAREVGRRKIRVNTVVPGFVATDLTADLPEAVVTRLRANECLPGGVTAQAVAQSVCFLLSDRADGITGQTLVIDAGASA
jgi:3-oxoacyl-[acyl-carrier protein] reductase